MREEVAGADQEIDAGLAAEGGPQGHRLGESARQTAGPAASPFSRFVRHGQSREPFATMPAPMRERPGRTMGALAGLPRAATMRLSSGQRGKDVEKPGAG